MNDRNSDTVSLKDLQAYSNKEATTSTSHSHSHDEELTVDADLAHRTERLKAKTDRIVPELSSQKSFESTSCHHRDGAINTTNGADDSLSYRDSLLAVYGLPETELSASSEHDHPEVNGQYLVGTTTTTPTRRDGPLDDPPA